jgi:hypothetical protein
LACRTEPQHPNEVLSKLRPLLVYLGDWRIDEVGSGLDTSRLAHELDSKEPGQRERIAEAVWRHIAPDGDFGDFEVSIPWRTIGHRSITGR